MYDVQDYDDPEEFYFDHMDEFEDVQDAEEYWKESEEAEARFPLSVALNLRSEYKSDGYPGA